MLEISGDMNRTQLSVLFCRMLHRILSCHWGREARFVDFAQSENFCTTMKRRALPVFSRSNFGEGSIDEKYQTLAPIGTPKSALENLHNIIQSISSGQDLGSDYG